MNDRSGDERGRREKLRERLQFMPAKPGVYLMRDRKGVVIYVGKSKNLKRRLADYLGNSPKDRKTNSLLLAMYDFEIHTTRTEKQALLLEEKLIVDFLPRYNCAQRGGIRRWWISFDSKERIPKFTVSGRREDGKKKRGGREWIGPFPSAASAGWMVRFVNRLFGLRSCQPATPTLRHHRHCLEPVTNSCSAPCVRAVSLAEYRKRLDQGVAWLRQPRWKISRLISEHMRQLARAKQFERAAECRDIISSFGEIGSARLGRGLRVGKELARAQMVALGETLGGGKPPRTMEAFDISHLGGEGNVAAVVHFVDGVPHKRRYRKYLCKAKGPDDTACIYEAVLRHYSKNKIPDLVVIDGGAGQLAAAQRALGALGALGAVGAGGVLEESGGEASSATVIALAKKEESILRPGKPALLLDRSSNSLHLVQRIRDEAHRMANGHTRNSQRRKMSSSELGSVRGVGIRTQKNLLAAFGSVSAVGAASEKQLVEVDGVGKKLAVQIQKWAELRKGQI